jgi:hypothetical protein
MAKQKRRNGRPRSTKNEKHPDVMNEIELELEQQRARKRALSEGRAIESPAPPPKLLGGLRYDAARKTYFPSESFPEQTTYDQRAAPRTMPLRPTNLAIRTSRPILLFPTSWIGPAIEQCIYVRRRQDLTSLWMGRLWANSSKVIPTNVMQGQYWKSMLPPLKRSPFMDVGSPGMPFPWDLGCKSNLAPATRTFDVLEDGTLVTLVEGGYVIRRPPMRAWTESHRLDTDWEKQTTGIYGEGEQLGHAIRFVAKDILVVRNAMDERALDFYFMMDGRDSNSCSGWKVESEHCGIHDFLVTEDKLVAFAPRIERRTTHVTLFHDLHTGCSTNMERKHFGSSDSLCLAFMGEKIVHGHRNGQLTLIDRRCQTPVAKTEEDSRGSITGIVALDDSHELLAKRSFGPVLLYDMRMVKVSQELTIASGSIHPTMSSCCVGLALDPTKKMVISPYSDAQSQVHLAIWSIQTGALLGTKQVGRHKSNGLPHFELRETRTPAWEWTRDGRDGDLVVTQTQGRWGLWFKSGAIEPFAPNSMGSIHHVHFPGSLTSN